MNALMKRPDEMVSFLASRRSELAAVCSKTMTPERVIQLATICTYKTPKIMECDGESIMASVCQAAALGYDLSPSAGECYLIPRWNKKTSTTECTLQVGYQGLTKSARSSGAIRLIQAILVRQDDIFSVTYRDGTPTITHTPNLETDANPTIVRVYAVAKLATGETMTEVMSADEIEYIRSKSEKPDSGPWNDFWGEMAKKTVIRRLCKSLPKSVELTRAIELHDAEYDLPIAQLEGTARIQPDNGSGHATGKYASPEQVAAMQLILNPFRERQNQRWNDHVSLLFRGMPPKEAKELANEWQLDGHLVKWLIATGRLEPGSEAPGCIKNRHIGRLTAIVWHRSEADRKAIEREAKEYIEKEARTQLDKLGRLYPDVFGEPGGEDDDPEVDAALDEMGDGFEMPAKAGP